MNIKGKGIYLKLLNSDDATSAYLNWMEDNEVTQFLESRWKSYTLDELKAYIEETNDGLNNFLFGIFQIESKEHIGNIKIGGINQIHRYADIGILIGNKKMWGKGYATEAINLITNYAFNELNLNKLIAGIYVINKGSYKAFMKANYEEAGTLKRHSFCNGKYIDIVLVEKIKDSFGKML